MNQLICASLSHTHYWYEVGMLKVPAYAELNIYLCNSTTFSLSVADNNQADAGQGDQARLVRLNFQARRGIGKNSCFPFQLTTNRITDIHMYIPRMHLQGHQGMFTVSVLYQHTSSSPTVPTWTLTAVLLLLYRRGFGP